MAELLESLQTLPTWLAILVIAGAAASEYLCPPLPGDLLALSAATLALTGTLPPLWVLAALVAGSLLGALLAFALGLAWSRKELSGPWALRRERVDALYARWGMGILAINRFIPGVRALLVLGAGLSRMPIPQVLSLCALSGLLWGSGVFCVAYFIQQHWL